MIVWDQFMHELLQFPKGTHDLRPPCPPERIMEEEQRLGRLPSDLRAMLQRFNGGELFIDGGPFVTLFGLFDANDPPDFDWGIYYIDRSTPTWRTKMNRPMDWVIAATCYGGRIVLGPDPLVRQWDSATDAWDEFEDARYTYEEWISKLLTDGATYLVEE
jgi:hypothetical protein